MSRPQRTYRLFTRCSPGAEPHILVSVDVYSADNQHVIGTDTKKVTKYGAQRGAQVFICHSYKELVAHATDLAIKIGMPKSRIWDIFDWNEGG